jgi:S-adenosylmethionine:tRNA ribosyltransferase-isomerase
LKTSDFHYYLPPEYIAQKPVEPRHDSRLLVLDRDSGELEQAFFRDLGRYLNPGDLLVINETRVIPARLFARKLPGGGRVELLLVKRLDAHTWEVMVGGKGLNPGKRVQLESGPQAQIVSALAGPQRVVQFDEPVEKFLDQTGQMPLPPYIHIPLHDPQRYQTVYAREPGSVAAPTAGLHFTPELMAILRDQGIRFATLILHVGLDTFAPVTEENPDEHVIHSEWVHISQKSADEVNRAHKEGGRIVAVGTTSVRALESAAETASEGEVIGSYTGPTSLYILPGYTFRVVDAMITNFHLPQSTLLMLVSAFAGRQQILSVYEVAIREGYRFYSFGDAMLIL